LGVATPRISVEGSGVLATQSLATEDALTLESGLESVAESGLTVAMRTKTPQFLKLSLGLRWVFSIDDPVLGSIRLQPDYLSNNHLQSPTITTNIASALA